VPGKNGARFTSELTVANRAMHPTDVTLAYTAAIILGSSGSGATRIRLGPGEQRILDDAIGFLRSAGLAIPVQGAQGGTLRLIFDGVQPGEAFAGARTTSASGRGRAGLFYAAIAANRSAEDQFVFGLRENSEDRSNLAVVNTSLTKDVTLAITLHDGSLFGHEYPLDPQITLGPGQWRQMNSVLREAGLVDAFAIVRRVRGGGDFFAFGVINDNGTNDGSFLSSVPSSRTMGNFIVPVIVDTLTFETELILANPSQSDWDVIGQYRESLNPAPGSFLFQKRVSPGVQTIYPDIFEEVRASETGIPPAGPTYAGCLYDDLSDDGLPPSPAYVGARVSTRGSGGRYGVFYPALDVRETAVNEAWIYGLRADDATRSNLALAAVTPCCSSTPLTFRIEVFDGPTGALEGVLDSVTLDLWQFRQFDRVLDAWGVRNGYVHIVRTGGAGRFVAYGILNDGGTPGAGTDDGSYIPMVVP
jgi:hypothetical protein